MVLLASVDSIQALQLLAEDYKFWLIVITIITAGYKAYDWVKQIRTRDLPDIHGEIKNLKTGLDSLGTKLDAQTTSVVGELKEMRSDFRTFYTSPSPLMMAAYARPERPAPKRKPRAKKTLAT